MNKEEHKKRTDQQRKAIEVYCDQVAKALNESDQSVQTVFTMPVQITHENIKENMFKVIMKALYPDKTSTTQLSTTEVQDVYEHMNKITCERFHVGIDWPSYESQLNESLYKGMK